MNRLSLIVTPRIFMVELLFPPAIGGSAAFEGPSGVQLLKRDLPLLAEGFPSFAFHPSLRNLGIVLDSTLTFSEHVANLTRSSYFHLRHLRAIRRSPLRLLSCLYLYCPCLHLLSNRLLQFSSGWSSLLFNLF